MYKYSYSVRFLARNIWRIVKEQIFSSDNIVIASEP